MATALTEGRRGLKAFRLSEIPIDVRLRAKERLLKVIDSPTERAMVGVVSEFPSETVYWIPREAWDALEHSFLWQRAARKQPT